MIRFAAPEWSLLLLAVACGAWLWPRLGLRRPLSLVCLTLATLALMLPQLRGRSHGLDLVVLIDRSASAAEHVAHHAPEWEALLEGSRGPGDHIHWVEYAAEVTRRDEREGTRYSGDDNLTRTALAIRYTLATADPERPTRLLLVTDGYATEPLDGLAEELEERGIPLDVRLVTPPERVDYRVADLRLPERVGIGEPFLVEFGVVGTEPGEVRYEILRDGQRIHAGTTWVTDAPRPLRFTDRSDRAGGHRYEVRLAAHRDAHPGNDRAVGWTEVEGAPRLLLVTAYRDDPLGAILTRRGFEVDLETEPESLHLGRLPSAGAVILNDVPANRLPESLVSALDFFVREQGGGLLMAGGRHSFGSGGYFGSPIEDLLPVSMELRTDEHRVGVAMALVMDRSGSMAAQVADGARPISKMQLANEGAAQAVELLDERDQITVFAVDSAAHEIVPLVEVGKERTAAVSAIRRVESQGGGIFVYTGLEAAWRELQRSDFGQRHVILFADAADAEEPGEYRTLIDRMVQAGATVSVIGLGSRYDPDAAFLQDVAMRGQGRIFFAAHPQRLPGLFAQETVSVARSAFVDEPTAVAASAGWQEIAARPLSWLAAVDGYNLSYARPGATTAATSDDESAAPLVAFWQRGSGRVAAVSFPLAGQHSERARSWPDYGEFAQTLVNWLMRQAEPQGVALRTRLDGTHLDVELLLDDPLLETIAGLQPRLVLEDGLSGERWRPEWERVGPGRYATRLPLPLDRPVLAAVQLGQASIPFGPFHVGSAIEWSFPAERVAELRQLARQSGGGPRLNLADVWRAPRPAQYDDVASWLLAALLGCFLADALLVRTGWQVPRRFIPGHPGRTAEPSSAARRTVPSPSRRVGSAGPSAPRAPEAPELPPAQPRPAAVRQARFARAKRHSTRRG